MTRSNRLWLSWGLMAVVFLGVLAYGSTGDTGPRTSQERVYSVADQFKCPQCVGQTVAESDVAIAREIRAEIARGIGDGRTDDEILDELTASYGEEYRLNPSAEGVTALVWIIPVVGAVGAVAALVFVFWRWRRQGVVEATDDDREIVGKALSSRSEEGEASP